MAVTQQWFTAAPVGPTAQQPTPDSEVWWKYVPPTSESENFDRYLVGTTLGLSVFGDVIDNAAGAGVIRTITSPGLRYGASGQYLFLDVPSAVAANEQIYHDQAGEIWYAFTWSASVQVPAAFAVLGTAQSPGGGTTLAGFGIATTGGFQLRNASSTVGTASSYIYSAGKVIQSVWRLSRAAGTQQMLCYDEFGTLLWDSGSQTFSPASSSVAGWQHNPGTMVLGIPSSLTGRNAMRVDDLRYDTRAAPAIFTSTPVNFDGNRYENWAWGNGNAFENPDSGPGDSVNEALFWRNLVKAAPVADQTAIPWTWPAFPWQDPTDLRTPDQASAPWWNGKNATGGALSGLIAALAPTVLPTIDAPFTGALGLVAALAPTELPTVSPALSGLFGLVGTLAPTALPTVTPNLTGLYAISATLSPVTLPLVSPGWTGTMPVLASLQAFLSPAVMPLVVPSAWDGVLSTFYYWFEPPVAYVGPRATSGKPAGDRLFRRTSGQSMHTAVLVYGVLPQPDDLELTEFGPDDPFGTSGRQRVFTGRRIPGDDTFPAVFTSTFGTAGPVVRVVQTTKPNQVKMADASVVFLGGRVYLVDELMAVILTEAGLGDSLDGIGYGVGGWGTGEWGT